MDDINLKGRRKGRSGLKQFSNQEIKLLKNAWGASTDHELMNKLTEPF